MISTHSSLKWSDERLFSKVLIMPFTKLADLPNVADLA